MLKAREKQASFFLQFTLIDASMSTAIHTATAVPELTSTQLKNIYQALDTHLNSMILLSLWHGQGCLLKDG